MSCFSPGEANGKSGMLKRFFRLKMKGKYCKQIGFGFNIE